MILGEHYLKVFSKSGTFTFTTTNSDEMSIFADPLIACVEKLLGPEAYASKQKAATVCHPEKKFSFL